MTLLLGGTASVGAAAASAASGAKPTVAPSWQVQVHDGVQVQVQVQCSADDTTAAVAVHLVDPLSRGAMSNFVT